LRALYFYLVSQFSCGTFGFAIVHPIVWLMQKNIWSSRYDLGLRLNPTQAWALLGAEPEPKLGLGLSQNISKKPSPRTSTWRGHVRVRVRSHHWLRDSKRDTGVSPAVTRCYGQTQFLRTKMHRSTFCSGSRSVRRASYGVLTWRAKVACDIYAPYNYLSLLPTHTVVSSVTSKAKAVYNRLPARPLWFGRWCYTNLQNFLER
jgi:hypothetical protein